MPLTNPPFTRDPKNPPLYLRDLEPEEQAQWERMRASYEALAKQPVGGQQNATPEHD
jgi:hypothetical protein